MPCMDARDNERIVYRTNEEHTNLVVAAENKRNKEIIGMRRWLSEELEMPGIMRLKGNPNIESVIRHSNDRVTKATKRADNSEYRLCRAIRVKIGEEEFESHMTNYPITNVEAAKLMVWWENHKREDAIREARERSEQDARRAREEAARRDRLSELSSKIERLRSEERRLAAQVSINPELPG